MRIQNKTFRAQNEQCHYADYLAMQTRLMVILMADRIYADNWNCLLVMSTQYEVPFSASPARNIEIIQNSIERRSRTDQSSQLWPQGVGAQKTSCSREIIEWYVIIVWEVLGLLLRCESAGTVDR